MLIYRRWQLRFAVYLGFGILSARGLLAQSEGLALDSRLRIGQLASGFRYVIFPRTQPAKEVCFRLVVKSGSVDESDSERGLAHFLEHMVFNGSTHFPPGSLETFLRQNGMALGADANADTHYGYTNFRFDLPNADGAANVLGILRDFADGATFDGSAVQREKKVILAEARVRNTSDSRVWQSRQKIDLQGSSLAEREPIGLETVIESATPDQLRKLYRSLYRPERMELVVVGAIDPAVIERQIRAAFSDFVAKGARVDRARSDFLYENSWRAGLTRSDLRDGNIFALISDTAVHPLLTEADNRKAYFKNIAEKIFDLRLQRLGESDPQKITFCNVQTADEPGLTRELICQISPRNSEWRDAATRLQIELRGSLEQGFTPAEIRDMNNIMTSFGRDFASQEASASSADEANRLVEDYLNDRITRSASQAFDDIIRYGRDINSAELLAAWRDTWSGWRTAWLLLGKNFPEKPVREDLLALLETNARVHLAERKAATNLKFPYEHFGPKGQIVSRRRLRSLDTEEIFFKNGLRLLIKKTDFAPDAVSMLLRVGNGRMSEPLDRPGLGMLGTFWIQGGLKQVRREDLTNFLLSYPGSLTVGVGSESMAVSTTTRPMHLLTFQQLLAAFLTEPAYAKERFPEAMHAVMSSETELWDGPNGIFQEEVGPREHNGDSRYFSARREEVGRYNAEQVTAWLQRYLQTSAITLIVVGDVEVEKVVAEAAQTVAAIALPNRTEAFPASGGKSAQAIRENERLEIASAEVKWPTWTETPDQKTYNFETNSPLSAVCIDWPVREAIDARRLAEARLLSEIMTERARAKIRQGRGESYVAQFEFTVLPGPNAGGWIRFFSDCKAADVESIVGESVGLLNTLRQHGVSPAELTRAQNVLLVKAEADRKKNDFWIGILSDRALDADSVERSLSFVARVREAQIADVNRFAQNYLRFDAFVTRIVAQPPKTGKSATQEER